MNHTEERHVGVLRTTPRFVLSVLASRTDIPKGAKIVGAGYDFDRDCFYFHLEHPTIPPTKQGELLPEVVPVVY